MFYHYSRSQLPFRDYHYHSQILNLAYIIVYKYFSDGLAYTHFLKSLDQMHNTFEFSMLASDCISDVHTSHPVSSFFTGVDTLISHMTCFATEAVLSLLIGHLHHVFFNCFLIMQALATSFQCEQFVLDTRVYSSDVSFPNCSSRRCHHLFKL